jgi:integrase
MPKKAKELGALEASRLNKPGRWSVGGVDGLALQVSPSGQRSWVLRYSLVGKRREMGLGHFGTVTLAQARDKAREQRLMLDSGADPIAQRQARLSAAAAAHAAHKTFWECATGYIAAHEAGWKSAKHGAQWLSTLETYAKPVIGSLLIKDVTTAHVLEIIGADEPKTGLWATKTETANRVRNRIELVWDWAKARGYCGGDNPARWKGHLDATLPKPTKIKKVEHHAAVPVADLGSFMAKLRQQAGMGARALEFAIQTAARSGEVRGATWGEIDLVGALWVIPGERMKAGREHRVPLSPAALALLKSLPQGDPDDLVFPGAKKGQPLSDMSLSAVMRRMKVDAVPHGFRSSFRDWASERTNYPAEVAEMALAHAVKGKVEAAYRRGDLLDKRKRLMADWSGYLEMVEPVRGGVAVLKRSA